MQGVQKLKCESCGVMFMSENGSSQCPSCSGHGIDKYDNEESSHSCGCGHH